GAAKAYDDVVDVNWAVWGDEWEGSLASLTASMALPGEPAVGEVRVWGHPATVAGTTDLGPGHVFPQLQASSVPAGELVELRVVLPRSALESTSGATVVEGSGLDQILDEERREVERAEEVSAAIRRMVVLVPFLAVGP